MAVLSGHLGFRWWLGAATVSTLGDSVTFFALAWVAAGHGPAVASLVLTLEAVPLCLLILVGGALADRRGIRQVMIGCDAFMVAVMALFALGALIAVPVWSLMLVALLSGTAAALRRPAAGVFPRLFATGDQLSRTMATTTLFQQLAQIAGPSVGGILLSTGGLSLTSALDAGSFLLVLLILVIVQPPHEPARHPDPGTSLKLQLREALLAARRTPGAPATILTIVGMAVTILPLVSLCVPLVGRQRGWGPGGTGLVAGAWVVGGLLVMAAVARRGMPRRQVALAGPAIATTGVVLLASTRSQAAAVTALGLVGVGTSMLTSRLLPRFMDATPAAMLARFSALLGLAQTGPVLVATPALGYVIGTLGARPALIALAVVLTLTLVTAHRAESQLLAQDIHPAEASAQPGDLAPP